MTGQGWAFGLLVILAIAVFAAVRAVTRARRQRMNDDPFALQILDEQFATGEIRREEYEERKRAILTMAAPTGNL
jgi:uncharacterized membrane protein